MSNSQPNAWHTASRNRSSQSASRTPQSRSGTASPSQQTPANQAPRQDPGRPQQQASDSEEPHIPANGFNAAEVKAFLGRDATTASYKVAESTASGKSGAGAWGAKPNHMANNQPFFVQLAKQIATLEGGG